MKDKPGIENTETQGMRPERVEEERATASRILCVIPARMGSTRLPGKPLELIAGIPLIVWVYRNALESGAFDDLCVATDDGRIAEAVMREGGNAQMTAATHESGTDRVFEAAARYSCTHIVNIQGDEPRIPRELLLAFSAALKQIDDNSLLTVVSHATIEEKSDPDTVKAVVGNGLQALYFSRAAIPYEREKGAVFYKHSGIYGFTLESLRRFCSFPQGNLERAERLEQLRALENGMRIQCIVHDFASIGIDTPSDLERFRQWAASNGYER
jgi:3-deoxy-manno-octulosonate cytidylyltransferase (CMP-KDO synthetase)